MSELEVYKAINAVHREIAKTGISKDQQVTYGGKYKFRGIDDVYNALSTIIAKNDLCIIPIIKNKDVQGFGNKSLHITIEAEYKFVSTKDGSSVSVFTIGEAIDQSDKGTNKAMSAAYKYAFLQMFCIPTEGDNDIENNDHRVDQVMISTKDAALIKQMLKQTGSDVKAFLNHIKAQDVDSMTEAQAKTAIHLLQQKVKRQQK